MNLGASKEFSPSPRNGNDEKSDPVTEMDSMQADDDISLTFPQKLMEMLDRPDYNEVVAWLPHGRGFFVFRKKALETAILPRHFHKQAKYSSFTRKLNRWGFVRITRGPETGAYYHPLFRRGQHGLVLKMSCRSGKKGDSAQLETMPSPAGRRNPTPAGDALLLTAASVPSEPTGRLIMRMQELLMQREIVARRMALLARSPAGPCSQGPVLTPLSLLLQMRACETSHLVHPGFYRPQWKNGSTLPSKPLLSMPLIKMNGISLARDG